MIKKVTKNEKEAKYINNDDSSVQLPGKQPTRKSSCLFNYLLITR